MKEPIEIRRSKNPRENARAVFDLLENSFNEQQMGDDSFVEALLSDATGLLAGIAQGTLKTGQDRIVDRLTQIVQNTPREKDVSAILTAISACSEFGLSVNSHIFSPLTRHTGTRDR